MSFDFYNPTRVFFGGHCVVQHPEVWAGMGQKALVVTGRSSAAKNGSLADLEKSLHAGKVSFVLLDGVEPDPSFATVLRGVAAGQKAGVQMVIGIGGGSAIDAAKAIAVLLANPGMTPEQLYEMKAETPALPIGAIPTTAGTGTEVTPYGVLTDEKRNVKRAFRSLNTFPHVAMVDAVYTMECPRDVTVDTAVDALSHLLEGFISRKAGTITDTLAEKGLEIFRECMDGLSRDACNRAVREKLMLASTLGGMVIASAGTATVHAMGYPLTVLKQVPHGRANGYLLTSQMKRCAQVSAKANRVLSLLRLPHWDAFQRFLDGVLPPRPGLTADEQKQFAALAIGSKNHDNNPYAVTEALLLEIYSENFSEVQ